MNTTFFPWAWSWEVSSFNSAGVPDFFFQPGPLPAQLPGQLGPIDGGGAHLAHHHPGADVGQGGRQDRITPLGQTQGHEGRHRVAGPGDVKDFPGPGGDGEGRLPRR